MSKTTVLEEFHVTVIASASLPKIEVKVMLRTVRSARFQTRMHEAVRKFFKRHPSLTKARFRLTR